MTADGRLSTVFYWAIALNLIYVVIEASAGWVKGSMGLLSDAGHNLGDVASLLISLVAYKAARRAANDRYTFGYGRATVEASLANAVILYVAVVLIAVESIDRLLHPSAVDGDTVAWVAAAGVVVNGVTAWMLLGHSRNDLNVRGAFMHMAADTLVSVGVVVSGIIIAFTGWYVIDPIIGLCIAVMIAAGSYSLLRESLRMALDGVPDNIDVDKVRAAILAVPEVSSMHHLHIWSMSTTSTALTVHVVVSDPSQIDRAIAGVREAACGCGISHSTIEAETASNECGDVSCSCGQKR